MNHTLLVICIHNWWTEKKRSWNLFLDCILRVYGNYPQWLQNLPCCLTCPFTECRKGAWFQISNNLPSTPDWLSLPIDFQPNVRMDQSGSAKIAGNCIFSIMQQILLKDILCCMEKNWYGLPEVWPGFQSGELFACAQLTEHDSSCRHFLVYLLCF